MAWDNDRYPPEGRNDPGLASLAFGLATLVIGAAVGAVTALLLAPKSGRELRSEVADTASHWKEHAAETIAQSRERVVSTVESSAEPPVRGPVRPAPGPPLP